ncbi:MAG: hypothetical protein NVS4B11_01270 [Ktedonobacteraceae bacterium]
MRILNERGKLGLLCLLLLLTLGLLTFTAVQTFQEIRGFQQQNRALKVGDVSTIRPWMTIHVVSHIYHIPESYLYDELRMSNSGSLRHATLSIIAKNTRQPVNNVIRAVQHAITTYRKEHPHFSTPTPMPPVKRQPLSARAGR